MVQKENKQKNNCYYDWLFVETAVGNSQTQKTVEEQAMFVVRFSYVYER